MGATSFCHNVLNLGKLSNVQALKNKKWNKLTSPAPLYSVSTKVSKHDDLQI